VPLAFGSNDSTGTRSDFAAASRCFGHLDLQPRLIGHEGVDSDEVGGLSVSNINADFRPERDKPNSYSPYEARERE